jgi:ABC-type transport system involved in multi-copper enzyme maturation permease subunit
MRAVFERDFLVFTSRPRFLVLRTLTVAAPAAILITVVCVSASASYLGSSEVGGILYGTFMVVMPAMLLLLSPVVAAPSIASERALHTLDIVLASPVSAYAFALAKFASRLCVALVLMAAVLPIAAVCFLYGGVSGTLFVELVAFSAGIAVLGTAAGTLSSAWSRGVATATTAGYFLAIFVPLLHLWMLGAAAEVQGVRFHAVGLLIEANPFATWAQLALSGFSGTTARHPGSTFLAWACGAAVVAVVAAGYRVQREAAHDVAPSGGRRHAAELRFVNPVLDRGLRGSLLARPSMGSWVMLGLLLVVAGAMLVIGGLEHDLDDEWPHLTFLFATTFLVALSALSRAAHSLAAERETGALDMLLATRLSAADVVRGKYFAVLAGVAPLLAIAFVYGLVAVPASRLETQTVVLWAVGACALTSACAAIGLWCSGSASTSGRAVLRAFAILIGGTIVHGIGAGILLAGLGWVRADWLMPYTFGASPIAVGVMGPALAEEGHWNHDEWNAFVAWLLWTCVYLYASMVLVKWTTDRVARRRDTA